MSKKEYRLKASSPWAQTVIDAATKPSPVDISGPYRDEFWAQVKNHDPEAPISGFDYEGNPLPGHTDAGYPIADHPDLGKDPVAAAVKGEPQKPYGEVLPTANPEDMRPIRDQLFDEAKSYIRRDPRFKDVRFDSSPRGRALTTSEQLAEEQSKGEFPKYRAKTPPPPPKEDDSLYQRAIYGMERGGASFAQSVSMKQSRALADQLAYLKKYPEKQQEYADTMGSMYNIPLRQGDVPGGRFSGSHYDKKEYMVALEDELAKLYKAQDIRRMAISSIPVSESLQKISEAETFTEAWNAFKEDWVGVLTEVTAESFPSMAPGIIAGFFGGPLSAAAMMGVSSYTVESEGDVEAGIMRIAQDIGADLSTVEGQQAVADDPRFALMLHEANVGGFIVGAFDTVAGLLPGISLLGKNKPIREAMLQTVAQMASGAGGEASRQIYQEGEIKYPGRVGLEAAAEGPLGVLEVAASTRGKSAVEKDTPDTKETTPVPPTGPEGALPTQDDLAGQGLEEELAGMSRAELEALNEQLNIPEEVPDTPQQTLDLSPQEGEAAPPTPTPVETGPQTAAETTPTPPVEDTPTAEPKGDIEAQLADLADPNSERLGVYLSPEQDLTGITMDLGEAVPLENFDGKGGTLIAKNEQVAMEATAARDGGIDMQQILGRLTLAGEGKPATGVVLQQKDSEGNVVRESAIEDPAEAVALAEQMGEGAEVVTPEEAIKRREDLIAEEEATGEPATEEPTVEYPLIQAKEVEKGFRDLNKRTKNKGFPAIRKAMQSLSVAIAAIFPDAKNLPSMSGTIGAPAIGRYFEALDAEILIDEVLPNLKEFLRAVVESPDQASAVQNINRLVDYVKTQGGGATIGTNVADDVRGAAEAIGKYDAFQAEREASKQEYTYTKKKTGEKVKATRYSGQTNTLKRRAYEADELATAVEALANQLPPESRPEGWSDAVRQARAYREAVDKPSIRITKGGAGSVSKDVSVKGRNITAVSKKLRAMAGEMLETAQQQSRAAAEAKAELKQRTAQEEAAAPLEPTPEPTPEPVVAEEPAAKEEAKPVTRKTMGKQSEGGMSDSFKTEAEIRAEEAIANDLNSLVEDANKVEEEGGIETFEGGREAYELSTKLTQHHIGPADLTNLSMSQLRTIAKAVGAAAARSKDVTIKRIYEAATAEVKRVEAALAETTAKLDKLTEGTIEAPNETQAANIQTLLELVQQVQTWTGEQAAKSKVKLAYHFRNVGDVVAKGWLNDKVQADLLEIFGAEKGADLKETRDNLMVATGEVVKTDRANKKLKREAKPEEVTDQPVDVEPESLGRGRFIAGILEEMGLGGMPLAEALEVLGIQKKTIEQVKAVLGRADAEGRTRLIQALSRYSRDRDAAHLLATLADVVNGEPSKNIMLSFVQLGEGMANKVGTAEYDQAEEQRLKEREAELRGYGSVEEMEEIEGGLGFDDSYDPNDYYHQDEIKELVDKLQDDPSPQDLKVLNKLANILVPLFESLLDAGGQLNINRPDGGFDRSISMNDLLDVLIENLPKNNKYSELAKRLRSLDLNVPINIVMSTSQITGASPTTLGVFNWHEGRKVDRILILNRPDNVADMVRTIFHEMVHAATTLKYFADEFFRSYVQELHEQAVSRLPNNFVDPVWRARAEAVVKDAKKAGLDTLQASQLLRGFLTKAGQEADPSMMKFRASTFHGLLNPREFIADAFTDANFQAWLAGEKLAPTARLLKLRLQSKTRPANNLIEAFMQAVQKIVLKYSGRNNILREILFVGAENLMTRAEYHDLMDNQIPRNRQTIRDRIRSALRPPSISAAEWASLEPPKGLFDRQQDLAAAGAAIRKAIHGSVPLTKSDAELLQKIIDRDPRLAAAIAGNLPMQSEPDVIVNQDEQRPIQDSNDFLDNWRAQKLGIVSTVKAQYKEILNAGESFLLKISGRDAIERHGRKVYDKAAATAGISNPLTRLDRAYNLAQTMVRKYEKQAVALIKKYSKITGEARARAEGLMRDITMANIDPTQPLNSAANAHIWTTPKDKTKAPKIKSMFHDRAIKARNEWRAFEKEHPKVANILSKMAALTREIHNTKVRYALAALGEAYGFDESVITQLEKVRTDEDVDRVLGVGEEQALREKMSAAEDDLFGLTKEETKDYKAKIKEAAGRERAAKSAKTILRESSIKGWYFPVRRYGKYVVSTGSEVTARDERFVTFFDTEEQAKLFAEAYNERYAPNEDDNKVSVSLKLSSLANQPDVVSVISDLKKRIRDTDSDVGQIFAGAIAEVLNSSAAYQSQLRRANIDGVAAQDMARGYEEYVYVSKYTLGDLRMAHTISDAIRDINAIAKNPNEYGLSTEEGIRAGLVQEELKKQIKVSRGNRKRGRISKAVGHLGFFNYLGAPSYWALNATQTYQITAPFFAAKYGEVEGPAELFKAQGLVFKAVYKTMKGSGPKDFEAFKANLPPPARKVVERMISELLLQATIAHEFGSILDPQGFKRMRKYTLTRPIGATFEFGLMLMEKIPEAIEHFNRISTGLAAYKLSDGDWLAVKDAVNETQMNYDTNNRARLLKAFPGDTTADSAAKVAPIMMFKTFGIGLLKLFYGAAFQAMFESGGRKEGMKLAGYLLTTHLLFGGVNGALMVAPIAAIIWAINQGLDPDDEFDLSEAARELGRELGGAFGEVALERGLPAAALGVDMSNQINLGNLLWMSDDRLEFEEYGDIQIALANLGGGPVGVFLTNAMREGIKIWNEDPRGGWDQFMKAAIPVKAIRAAVEAFQLRDEGLTTANELMLMSPEDFNGFIQTFLGFQSTQKTTVRNEYYRDQRLEHRRNERRRELIAWANKYLDAEDWAGLDKIIKEMEEFNLSVPEFKYGITQGQIMELRERQRKAQLDYYFKYGVERDKYGFGLQSN